MKLLYLANIRLPTEKAHGLQIMKMCEAFLSLGLEVELVVPKRRNTLKQDPFEFYSLTKKFKITRLPVLDLIGWVPRLGFWLEFFTFLLSARIYSLFRAFDLVYTRDQIAGLFFTKTILEIHSLPAQATFFHKISWKKARRLAVLTGFIKERLVAAGVGAEKILVSPDAVDLGKFSLNLSKSQARAELGLPADLNLVGYVGMLKTMDMEKGIDTAISALIFLPSNTRLVLVGGHKDDIASYQQFAAGLGLSERVKFIGQVAHNQVPKYLKAFDVLVAPFPENEHYKFYMSPLKIFEYLASQRPIVASDLPSLREVLNARNSLLCRPADPKDLAEKLKQIQSAPDLSEKLAAQGFLDAQNYTWEKRAKGIIKKFT